MFELESDMIPVLKKGLAEIYNAQYFAAEFNTGNGVADLVFSKKIYDQPLIFNNYGLMSLFTKHFNNAKKLEKSFLDSACINKINLKKLLTFLEESGYIIAKDQYFVQRKKYKPHTEKMVAIEAKLRDWKSGINQALRYQFFTHKSFLAYPQQYIHRVDLEILKKCNIGLISVDLDKIRIILNPIERKPIDLTSYYFLSECFALRAKQNVEAEFYAEIHQETIFD